MGAIDSRISLLICVVVLQACGSNTPPPSAKTAPETGGVASVTSPASPVGNAKALEPFEKSAFCQKYGCNHHESWPLKGGVTNHSYRVNPTPARLDLTFTASLEVPATGDDIERYGFKVQGASGLGDPELHVVDDFLAAIEPSASTDVLKFVHNRIEEPVEEIRVAKSTPMGRYFVRVGTVGNDKVVSLESKSLPNAGGPPGPPPGLVSFTVAARASTSLILLVPANAVEDDLQKLLYALRDARKKGTLNQFFTPTTPGVLQDPYSHVQLFVMSDPTFATVPKLQAFIHPAKASPGDASPFEMDFGRQVRAFYYFATLTATEEGMIGYADDEIRYTKDLKKLF